MNWIAFIFAAVLLAGCQNEPSTPLVNGAANCRGIYFERDSLENLKKFNEYRKDNRCLIDNVPLTKLEATAEAWRKNNTKCKPVESFPSRTLVSANNYYSYRNNRIWLDLDSASGVSRRLVLSEDREGKPSYSKLQSCFFVREGQGTDAGFGKQLLLDTNVSKLITSQSFDPAEVFRINDFGADVNFMRWDDVADWDYRFCPFGSVPWGFCEALQRDGNEFFFPELTVQEKVSLVAEAILIAKEFNFSSVSKTDFEHLWNTVAETRNEIDYSDQKYKVIHMTDTPLFVDQSWMQFIRNERPWMPNVNSIRVRPVCYRASRSIQYDDGSTGRINGEACHNADGSFSFQPD